MSQNSNHLPWLDVIRFLAAFAVVCVHVRSSFFMTYSMLEPSSQNIFTQIFFFFNSFGAQGVLVFYILSGFLVGGKASDRMIKGESGLSDYIIDRSVRIGMPLAASLILIWIVDHIVPLGLSQGLSAVHDMKCFMGNFFGLQGVLVGDAGGTFWTLAYEIWFYVLLGAIMAVTGKSSWTVRVAGLFFLFITILVYSQLEFEWISILFLGMIAYCLSKEKISRRLFIFSLICAAILFCANNFAAPTLVKDRVNLAVPPSLIHILLGIFSLICVAYVVNHPPKTCIGIKINKCGTWLASFSYSLYITHFQAIRLMRAAGFPQMDKVNASTVLLFFGELSICFIFAYGFYWLTERHTSAMKQWIKSLLRRKYQSA